MVVDTQNAKHRFALVGGAFVLAGCMTVGPQTNSAYRIPIDGAPHGVEGATTTLRPAPEWPSPSANSEVVPTEPPRFTEPERPAPQPKDAPEEKLPEPAPGSGRDLLTPSRTRSDDGLSKTDPLPPAEPPSTGNPPSPPTTDRKTVDLTLPPLQPVLPKIEPGEVSIPSRLELLVNVPRRKAVGTPAPYRLLVRNAGDQPAEEVDIHCQLDGPLTFNNTKQREVRRRLGRLLPGESQELTLNLLAREAGNHCCRFSVKSLQKKESVEAVWKSVCVEFVPQQVQIELLGPALRTVGSRAEFNFKVTNRSKRILSKVHLALTHDAAIVPVAATKGVVRGTSEMGWDLSDLQPEESAHFQVEFDCRATADHACVQIETSGAGITSDQTETCLQIVPVSGNLDLRIADREDPIAIGKRGQYEITLQNIGRQTASQLRLDVRVPSSLKVISGQVMLGSQLLPLKYALVEGGLLFDPVMQLDPEGKLVYLIDVEAVSAGTADVRATIRSGSSPTAISASEPTWITED